MAAKGIEAPRIPPEVLDAVEERINPHRSRPSVPSLHEELRDQIERFQHDTEAAQVRLAEANRARIEREERMVAAMEAMRAALETASEKEAAALARAEEAEAREVAYRKRSERREWFFGATAFLSFVAAVVAIFV